MVEQLKPCPFCGNAPEIVFGINKWWVLCHPHGCRASSEMLYSKEDVIAAWNRRDNREAEMRKALGDLLAFAECDLDDDFAMTDEYRTAIERARKVVENAGDDRREASGPCLGSQSQSKT